MGGELNKNKIPCIHPSKHNIFSHDLEMKSEKKAINMYTNNALIYLKKCGLIDASGAAFLRRFLLYLMPCQCFWLRAARGRLHNATTGISKWATRCIKWRCVERTRTRAGPKISEGNQQLPRDHRKLRTNCGPMLSTSLYPNRSTTCNIAAI